MRWLDFTEEERRIMLHNVSDTTGLPEYAVEKDWWVTMVLKALFITECSHFLEFKGGTSLSKGWHLIERFSEDIDIALSHHFFAQSIDNSNQLKKLRKQSRQYVVESLSKDLDDKMQLLGLHNYKIEAQTMNEDGTDISTDADPTVLFVHYDTVSPISSLYVQSKVKVEISCLSMDEPFELKRMRTMISEFFPDDDSTCEIPVVLPSRTFLEKAFLLCEEFQKSTPRSIRMSRHLYDLERLMDTEYARDALNDTELYSKVVEHRRKFYHVGYANYDKDYPSSIDFIPPEPCLNEWKDDYNELLEHFVYGKSMSFESLLDRIKQLQTRFRDLCR